MALGHAVDGQLARQDVRLTMGGEPTFVSVDDRDGAEWNTDALGPTKRGFATELVHRLLDKYGQGGFLHFGQGKWYPGEQLPRWALSICWRADGQPCWHDPSLFADERDIHRYTTADAQAFIGALTQRLGLDPKYVHPGYEDTFYYLWRERRLPVNVDPFDSRLDDEMERQRLRRIYQQGLDSVVGYVLPLRKEWVTGTAGPAWITGAWFVRDDRLYLFPGDSPMGYRLPLDSLPWAKAEDQQPLIAQDPFAARSPLAQRGAVALADARLRRAPCRPGLCRGRRGGAAGPGRAGRGRPGAAAGRASGRGRPAASVPQPSRSPGRAPQDPDALPRRHESAGWITRTALCVEVRDPQRANGPKAEARAWRQERRHVCLHAAAAAPGGLPGTGGRGRGHGASSRA